MLKLNLYQTIFVIIIVGITTVVHSVEPEEFMKNPKKMLFDIVNNIIPDIKYSISKKILAEKLYETL